jgi:hypothetical protein
MKIFHSSVSMWCLSFRVKIYSSHKSATVELDHKETWWRKELSWLKNLFVFVCFHFVFLPFSIQLCFLFLEKAETMEMKNFNPPVSERIICTKCGMWKIFLNFLHFISFHRVLFLCVKEENEEKKKLAQNNFSFTFFFYCFLCIWKWMNFVAHISEINSFQGRLIYTHIIQFLKKS